MDETLTPDLDFDKYAVKLAELGKYGLLEHINYWRTRCLVMEHTARLAVEAWPPNDYDSEVFDALMHELDRLTAD